jgi:dihydroflavonol-4-reductase
MILLTGATGLLGIEILRKLLEAGHKVRAVRRESSDLSLLGSMADQVEWAIADINDLDAMKVALEGVSYVIHAAAMVSFDKRDHEKMMHVNVEGTSTLCHLSIDAGIKHFIMVSSVAALGRVKEVELMDENAKWLESSLNSQYAKSKYLAELEVWRAGEEGLPFTIVNPSVILGMGDLQRSSAKLFKYVWDQKPFYTDAIINYVDVWDVADCIVKLIELGPQNDRYILSAGDIPYKDFFGMMAKHMGKRAPMIKAGKAVVYLVVIAETVKGWITGKSPLVTVETARLSQKNFRYSNKKSIEKLGVRYRPLQESIARISAQLIEKLKN